MRSLLALALVVFAGCSGDRSEAMYNQQIGAITGAFEGRVCECTWHNLSMFKDVRAFSINCATPGDLSDDFSVTFPEPPQANQRYNLKLSLGIDGALDLEAGRAVVEMAGKSLPDPRGGALKRYYRPFFVHELAFEGKDRFCEILHPDNCFSIATSSMAGSAFFCRDLHALANDGRSE